jgi:peptidoglycan/xylan/chitin deacetylase (PgdA/CDA1 family)
VADSRLAAVTIDLDEVHHYRAIHGLPVAPPNGDDAAARIACTVGLSRAVEFAARLDLPLTLFVVGDDLRSQRVVEQVREAARVGHAIESHSMSHPYDLVRLGLDRIRREVTDGFDVIERCVGRRPQGFRAPGYTTSDVVFDALEEAGARFDSSVFPCPVYDAAKILALASMHMVGRRSRSIMPDPRVWLASTEPYRPGRPYQRPGNRALIEIPIRVTRGARLPVIGTSLALAGPRGARLLVRTCAAPRVFNLELHALDFLGREDGLEDLVRHQPDLARPRQARLAAIEAAILELRATGYQFVTLATAAAVLANEL